MMHGGYHGRMTRTEEQRVIVGMGGGGFSEEPENPRLDDHVLGLTGKARPRVCFVPTGAGDSERYIASFRAAFPPARAEASCLTLFKDPGLGDVREHVLAQDVVYVGGGSTFNLLALWRAHGLDRVMREAWERGVVLAGVSAGLICWFESSVTDSLGHPASALRDGLGFLPGSACPHYDEEEARRPSYRRLVGEGVLPPGYAADGGAALVFRGTRLEEVVASRPAARGWRLDLEDGEVVERELPTRYLA